MRHCARHRPVMFLTLSTLRINVSVASSPFLLHCNLLGDSGTHLAHTSNVPKSTGQDDKNQHSVDFASSYPRIVSLLFCVTIRLYFPLSMTDTLIGISCPAYWRHQSLYPWRLCKKIHRKLRRVPNLRLPVLYHTSPTVGSYQSVL